MMTAERDYAKLGDLVIVDTGILGKIVYKICRNNFHYYLEEIDNGFKYDHHYYSLTDLDKHIRENPDTIRLIAI